MWDLVVRCGEIQRQKAWNGENQSALLCRLWVAGSFYARNQTGKFPPTFYPHWNWSVHISVCNTTLPTSKQIVTANPWSSVAILCGVFMALFKAANFAKLTIQWIIRMRKRHLRNKARELKQVTWEALQKDTDDTICSRSKSSKWWIWGLFLCFLRSLIAPFYNLWEALSTLRIVYP